MADLFEPLYSADEMRAAEERYPAYPDSIPELMERAGAAVAHEAMLAFPAARSFACVCGGGSNGGDGRVAARVLREAGHVADETAEPDGYDVVVDALFGTGFRGAPRPDSAELVERINATPAPVVSVDLPSGVDASTGEIAGAVVDADLTVTFHALKVGLAIGPGRFHAGRVVVADIGLEAASTGHRRASAALLSIVPRRGARDTKYSSGSVIVVGGQPGMTGAACLSAMAALRADAGYVTLAIPEEALPAAEVLALEPVKIGWSDVDAAETIARAAERATALAIGPGLGRSGERRALVRELLERLPIPAIVDADALFGLEPLTRIAPTVLTPHAGELARLLDTDSDWVDAHRLAAAQQAADRLGFVVVLKGADTIVAAPGEGVIVCDLGPPSLATAGTGDVLTGVIGAFLAKGLEPQLAAAAGAVAHARAAELVPHRAGLLASDLLGFLPAALDG
ncbi:MAG: Multifunctional fusion protein [Thermoleophilia bacterium]|nr:Multifunctional fusion protein [Thermoleophilia bacterium]